MQILDFIKQTIGKSLTVVLIALCDAVKSIADLLMAWHKTKQKKEAYKEKKEKEDKLDNIANNGTLNDLLDL